MNSRHYDCDGLYLYDLPYGEETGYFDFEIACPSGRYSFRLFLRHLKLAETHTVTSTRDPNQ
jgi:hypothetical protein